LSLNGARNGSANPGLLGAGFVAILIGSIYLWVVLTARRRIRSVPEEPAQAENAV
jgi:hypothetical protein